MGRITPYSGLLPSDCDAYVATQAGDLQGLVSGVAGPGKAVAGGMWDRGRHPILHDVRRLPDRGRSPGWILHDLRGARLRPGALPVNGTHCTD